MACSCPFNDLTPSTRSTAFDQCTSEVKSSTITNSRHLSSLEIETSLATSNPASSTSEWTGSRNGNDTREQTKRFWTSWDAPREQNTAFQKRHGRKHSWPYTIWRRWQNGAWRRTRSSGNCWLVHGCGHVRWHRSTFLCRSWNEVDLRSRLRSSAPKKVLKKDVLKCWSGGVHTRGSETIHWEGGKYNARNALRIDAVAGPKKVESDALVDSTSMPSTRMMF